MALKCDDPASSCRCRRSARCPSDHEAKPQTWQIPICVAFEAGRFRASPMQFAVGSEGSDRVDRRSDLSHLDSAQRRRDRLLPGRLPRRSFEEGIGRSRQPSERCGARGCFGRCGVAGRRGRNFGASGAGVGAGIQQRSGLACGANGVQHRGAAAGAKACQPTCAKKGLGSFGRNSARRPWPWGGPRSPAIATTRVCFARNWFRSWPSTGEEKELVDQAGNVGARRGWKLAAASLPRCWRRCSESLLNSGTAICSIRFEPRPFRSANIRFAKYCWMRLVRSAIPNWRGRRSICCCPRISTCANHFIRCCSVRSLTWIRATFHLNL